MKEYLFFFFLPRNKHYNVSREKMRIVTGEKVFETRNEIIFTTMRTQRANKALGYIDGGGSRKGGAKRHVSF